MQAIIFDTETTGLVDPEVIEAAWVRAQITRPAQGPAVLQLGQPVVQRYQPSRPISMGAMATHHILDEELVDQPPSSTFELPPGVQYLIGHNVDFDWKVAGSPAKLRRIDTLVLARALWPECDSHSLGALIYYLFRPTARERLARAHSADADVMLTGLLLQAILEKWPEPVADIEGLWRASEKARVPTVMPFGKHKGLPIAQVPRDYKDWLMRQPDVDPYLVAALR